MRLAHKTKLAAVAAFAASGMALAAAPADAATQSLQKVACDSSSTSQLQTWTIVTPWPVGCYEGSGDLDVDIAPFAFKPGKHSGYFVLADGTKVNFTAGQPKTGLNKSVVHIHTN
ncbi:hypothetical protein ABZ419_12490 [Streptomyces cinnamoneus]|uniref:hypothetical protein n=1 Tax=Streptomyces cinnamoneus TaxID=53446 RepID=UPI0033D863FC